MSGSTTSLHPLSTVVKHGKTLAVLLNEAKDNDKDEDKARSRQTKIKIYEKTEEAIMELVREFGGDQGRSALFPDECVGRLVKKIEASLEEFIKIDTDNKPKYENLANKVHDLNRAGMRSTDKSSYTKSSLVGNIADPGYRLQHSPLKNFEEKEIEDAYNELNEKERHCLVCFTLFPADAVVKKRELIHCWIGMGFIGDFDASNAGDNMLSKLSRVGLVERIIGNRRTFSRYRLRPGLRRKLETDKRVHFCCYQEINFPWSMFYSYDPSEVIRPLTDPFHSDYLVAMLNIKLNILKANTFASLSYVKNLCVVHLGTWENNPENYVMYEDGMFQGLQNAKQLKFLSFRGVSGLTNLPMSVYMLYNLKVLDLRACNNLQVIDANGIIYLKKLTHLDVSECYLLDHLPKAITKLDQLQVLKGFIIDNPLLQTRKQAMGNKPENNPASPCLFSDLIKLKQLVKLTVRTRRLNFPTAQDIGTLCELTQLTCLRVAWVGGSNDCQMHGAIGDLFPENLVKLELQAAPEGAVSRLLALISTAGRSNRLKMLHIKGGDLSNFCAQKHQIHNLKVLRLRYLPQLHTHWVQFKLSFPGLRHLEVLGCPNLVFFPCDQNGVWESTN